ncbi:MAG: glycosyltransferase family 4 protein [Planctomycetota bacterium]|nr:glycosyltransferase family 4 protein [Planctomycetota bacterium]MDP6761430.1 glycosyltransferase family 4 protein [Planctomycetota bacterium]MDP6988520.1 glycosyltransferase family 4 protein [Planctomycetota bacterium]
MRVLHVITTLDVGGAEMHLLSQVRGQCARGHAVRVRYLKGECTLAEDFAQAGAEQVRAVSWLPWGARSLAADLAWADVVHSHLLKADGLTGIAASLRGRRSRWISGKHNDEQVLLRPAISRLHHALARLPRRTIVLSDHVGRFFGEHGGVGEEGLRRIYYGIDPAPFFAAVERAEGRRDDLRSSLGFRPDDVLFVCVARFAPQKAHDVLLRAFAAACGAPDAVPMGLLLVGDDPFGDGRRRAEALAEELELGGRVRFAGIRRDVPDLLAASDAFVMSSLWEGLGLVFLEAMACGLPVLSTRVSAIPEVVVEGETGVLVPPGDAPALARELARLAADLDLRRVLGEAGRERVSSRFGLDRMVEETLDVYREVTGEDGA